MEILEHTDRRRQRWSLVHLAAPVCRPYIQAESSDENGRPAVAHATGEGARRFAALTGGHIGRQLAIVLDGRIQSAPVITHAITGGDGTIVGGFSAAEAHDLALVLRSGALPVSMTYLGGQYVGPTLGLQSIQAGISASLAGLGLVAAFMLVYYNRAGINALFSVIANLVVLLGLMSFFGAALTLPGIAGLILTIGMGVDANVLIFERIKEELKAGRAARSAIATGFDRVFLTILDTHVASLVAAAFCFSSARVPSAVLRPRFRSASRQTCSRVVVSRTLFELATSGRRTVTLKLSTFAKPAAHHRLQVASEDRLLVVWHRCGHWACATARRRRTRSVSTSRAARSSSQLRGACLRGGCAPGDSRRRPFSAMATRPDRTLLIRVPQFSEAGAETDVDAIKAALARAKLPAFEISGSETVTSNWRGFPKKAVFATIASLAALPATSPCDSGRASPPAPCLATSTTSSSRFRC
jgi:protein-export SecD/SecF family membrane protein